MTEQQLREIEDRANAATSGPWEWSGCDGEYESVSSLSDGERDFCDTKNDRQFIAHAREDVPALIAEVRRLNAEVAMLRGEGCQEDGDGPCGVCLECALAGCHVRQNKR